MTADNTVTGAAIATKEVAGMLISAFDESKSSPS